MKPEIFHIITNMRRGGAETLLAGYLPDLGKHYRNVLVTLEERNDFGEELEACGVERVCLHVYGKRAYPAGVAKLRRLIRQRRPALVHSHLFIPSLLARFACPKNVPLLFSLHSIMGADTLCKPKLRLLEKLAYRPRHGLLAVSQAVLADYDRWIGIKGRSHVLHNYINDAFFEAPKANPTVDGGLSMVAVGTLGPAKNYVCLLDAFQILESRPVSLDIYGEGADRPMLEERIAAEGLPINLKGVCGNLPEVLPGYDVYVMPSLHEGFGMAPLEAMACGLPALLSGIPALHEMSGGKALFFNPNEPQQLADLVGQVLEGTHDLKRLSLAAMAQAAAIGKREGYVRRLMELYGQALNQPVG